MQSGPPAGKGGLRGGEKGDRIVVRHYIQKKGPGRKTGGRTLTNASREGKSSMTPSYDGKKVSQGEDYIG